MKTVNMRTVCQDDPLVKGQFHTPIDGFYHFLKNIRILTLVYVQGMVMIKPAGATKTIKD
jgi:hypothetical protein